jgi:thioredoxin-like negative regulator of GroEL
MGKWIVDLRNSENENLFHFLTKNAKVCVVDFYADWCGPCLKLGQELEKKLQEETKFHDMLLTLDSNNSGNLLNDIKVKDKIVFLKLNVDAFGDLAGEFKVKSIPHVIFYKNGNIQSEISRNCEQIFSIVNRLLK